MNPISPYAAVITRRRPSDGRPPVTYRQAMEIFERFCTRERGPQAAPTIAREMEIPYTVVCDVLGGKHWPAARQCWCDRIFP